VKCEVEVRRAKIGIVEEYIDKNKLHTLVKIIPPKKIGRRDKVSVVVLEHKFVKDESRFNDLMEHIKDIRIN
jgi:hypothetical protein